VSDRIPGSSPSNPIKYRGWNINLGVLDLGHQFAFEYAHDDYDGAEDAFDSRCGYAASVEDAKRAIDAYENDEEET
jgi:hypothetical protein